MVKKKKNIGNIIILIVIIIIIAILIYSVVSFKKSVGEKGENFVICDKENNCLIAMHIHTEVDIKVCGKEIKIPLEAGDKTGTHTHKERNLLHFEERLKYDNKTQTIIETEPITLKNFFNHKDVKIIFNNTCIADKCNGDLCNGKERILYFRVNDKQNHEFENYVWKDGDKIKIIFDQPFPEQ